MRTAIIECVDEAHAKRRLDTVQRYMPSNYTARVKGNFILIEGKDQAGWTLDGYVIPRLASGLICASEIHRLTSSTCREYVTDGYSVTIQHCEKPGCDKYLGVNYPSEFCADHR